MAGEATGYAHATELSEDAIARAAETVQRGVRRAIPAVAAGAPARTNVKLYTDIDPLETAEFEAKVKLLEEMNAYARAKDSRVRQVSASLSGEWQRIEIMRAGGEHYSRHPPAGAASTCRWWWKRTAARNPAASAAAAAAATRPISIPTTGKARSTKRCARRWSIWQSVPAPAGEMTVVLGPGWPGILLHEAIGHGLEGDFNRKKTSRLRRPAGRARRGAGRDGGG